MSVNIKSVLVLLTKRDMLLRVRTEWYAFCTRKGRVIDLVFLALAVAVGERRPRAPAVVPCRSLRFLRCSVHAATWVWSKGNGVNIVLPMLYMVVASRGRRGRIHTAWKGQGVLLTYEYEWVAPWSFLCVGRSSNPKASILRKPFSVITLGHASRTRCVSVSCLLYTSPSPRD